MGFWCIVEFWINRYQTLLSAIVAIVGVAIAARPAWRQVHLITSQNEDLRRRRVLTYYDTLSSAIAILDGGASWPEEVKHPELSPTTEEGLVQAYFARQRAMTEMEARLAALPLQAQERSLVNDGLEKMTPWLKRSNPLAHPELLAMGRERTEGISNSWFYCVDQPDRVALYVRNELRQALDRRRSELVQELG